MGAFLPSHNDPILSILLLLGIIFVISILSYAYTIWKQEKRQKELLSFLKSFDSTKDDLNTESLEFNQNMKKPLFLLAYGYEKSGDFAKAINLYLYLIKHTNDRTLLKHLASSYQKAGFLQRAIDIYLEILSATPRDKESLYKLEFIYEKLREFKRANEVLEVLDAQEEDVNNLKSHLELQKIVKTPMRKEEKIEKLIKLLDDTQYKWVILRELFKLDALTAWEYYEPKEYKKLIDILWKLESWQINFDIIQKHNALKKLYYAKSLLEENPKDSSGFFAIDLIADAKATNRADATFKYSCLKCKNSSPLPFLRCPNCHMVYRLNIEVSVEEKRKKSSYSLQ